MPAHSGPSTPLSLSIVDSVPPWVRQETPRPHIPHNAPENVKWQGKNSDKICFNETHCSQVKLPVLEQER